MAVDLEAAAKEAAGNWQKFESFGWYDRPDDAQLWAIFYTSNRDSGILDTSNAEAIARVMAPYVRRGFAVEESHGHWAVGHVDGYSLRVYRPDGKITRAFRTWVRLSSALEEYPVLDEDDYSRRELEATEEAWRDTSMRDRLDMCRRAGVRILAARHLFEDGRMDDSDRNRLEMYVRDRWVNS